MRCPKCHYISFGSTDRCRNCGYEFVLAAEATPLDLPIGAGDEPIGPLTDFVLAEPAAVPRNERRDTSAAGSGAGRSPSAAARLDLPLFGRNDPADDAPLVTPSAVPRAPLAVRRSQPAPRPSTERPLIRDDPGGPEPLARQSAPRVVRLDDGRPFQAEPKPAESEPLVRAPVVARAAAGLIDVAVILGIDAVVLYFTLKVVELPLSEIGALPVVPLGVFLLLLNGGYLAIFTAAGGQTIGKMLAGIKVVSDRELDEGHPRLESMGVDLGSSAIRAVAYLASLLPAGLGFAAILFDADGRALHDRLAETRVVKA
jgi:uncharacterized RDD family membrane protein YckC